MSKINKFTINGDWLSSLKQKIDDSSMNSTIWGAEYSDGSWDSKATETTFQVREKYDNGLPKTMRLSNNGISLPKKDLRDRFLRFPETLFTYDTNNIGCKGGGTKLTTFRVGVFTNIWSYNDGQPYHAKLSLCSDREGKNTIEYKSDTFSKEKYQEEVLSIQVDIEDITTDKLPPNMSEVKGIAYEINFFNNTHVKFSKKKLETWLSTRYSQVKNFKVYFEDITENKTLRSQIPKTHLGIFEENRAVYDYSDLTKDINLIEVDDVKFEFYYGCRVSKNQDQQNWQKLESVTSGQNVVKSLKGSIRGEAPLILHLNDTEIVVFIDNLTPTEFDHTTSWMIYAIKPLININKKYSVNKSDGYSDGDFAKKLHNEIKFRIKKLGIKNNYANSRRKLEDSEVEQFLNKITDKTSTEIQKDFKSLVKCDVKTLTNKNNWILLRPDTSAREIDLRNENAKLWFEFQPSIETSDTRHLDGISTRINLAGRGDSPYDTFVWVAKNHTLRSQLIDVLKGLKWEDNCLKQVVLLTSNEVMNGFDCDEVLKIDIDKEVKKSNGFF